MSFLLRIKHWQLFLLTFGSVILGEVILLNSLSSTNGMNVFFTVFPLVMAICVFFLFGWIYYLGVGLHPKLPPTVKVGIKRFKAFMIIPVVYMLAIFPVFLFIIPSGKYEIGLPGILGIIFPLHIFSMFCILHNLYIVAKMLKAVEWQKPVTFSDFVGEFFLLWFAPVGVWILQPRINKLFAEKDNSIVPIE